MMLPTIKDIPDLEGKRVLVRVDWNVPLENGAVRDDFRIRQSLETIQFLREAKAKVALMTHIESKETDSLQAVYEKAKELLPELTFVEESDLYLMENLRRNEGEKNNDEGFAKSLAEKGDIYVNEAFSVSHRAHASVVGVPKFLPGFVGLEFAREVENLSKAFNPPHPFVFILGGAKFDTKIPLLNKFKDSADTIFVGGALAHNFFKEKGFEVGTSLVSDGDFGLAALFATGKVTIPTDVVVTGSERHIEPANDVHKEEKIVDAGPETVLALTNVIQNTKFILWNGPVGFYEEGFREGTQHVARAIAASGAISIVGGADTLAAIKELGLDDKFTFISTAGGAMLDFLANETLPGIEALKH